MRRCRNFLLALSAALLLASAVRAEPPPCGGASLTAALERDGRLAASLAAAAKTPNAEGLLWRIERPGVAPSHLFGTMHLTDPRAAVLPPLVRQALAGARSVALELAEIADPQGAALIGQKVVEAALVPGGDSLGFLADAAARRELEATIGEYGVSAEMAHQLQPWFLAVLVSLPVCEMARQGAGLDTVDKLVAQGRPPGARLVGLETPDEQVAALKAIDAGVAREALATVGRYRDRREDIYATLVDLYLQRRIAALREVFVAGGLLTPAEVEAYAAMETALRAERDPRMAARALPLLEAGGAFIAVGALHLGGADGLVERFRRAGFSVTRVY